MMDLPEVGGRTVERSLKDLERAAKVCIMEESEKLLPNNALIGVLCDTVRLVREYGDNERKGWKDLTGKLEAIRLADENFRKVEAALERETERDSLGSAVWEEDE